MREMERRAPSPAHFALSLICATPHVHANPHPPPWGLCKRQNCPMLDMAADPDGACSCATNRCGRFAARVLPLSVLNMQRLTARLLLLVLFAGTLAPFAAAASLSNQPQHCARMPLPVREESTPSCHHHAAAATHESPTPAPVSGDSLHSNPCCTGHDCCRPLARLVWAQPSRQPRFDQAGQASGRVPFLRSQIRSFEFAALHSGRAPPAL